MKLQEYLDKINSSTSYEEANEIAFQSYLETEIDDREYKKILNTFTDKYADEIFNRIKNKISL